MARDHYGSDVIRETATIPLTRCAIFSTARLVIRFPPRPRASQHFSREGTGQTWAQPPQARLFDFTEPRMFSIRQQAGWRLPAALPSFRSRHQPTWRHNSPSTNPRVSMGMAPCRGEIRSDIDPIAGGRCGFCERVSSSFWPVA